jgi:nucleoside-diphosphate-sugar epimerase
VRAFVTGATGFIGGRLAERLRARGDEVVALVRSSGKAGALRDQGVELVPGDLGDEDAIRGAVQGCDAAFHVAAMYKVGIRRSERPAMYEANVVGTERVLDAATKAGVARIVYVSTNGILGDTRGQVVDETYERPDSDFHSYYEETKYLAHQAAKARIAARAPVLIAQPGGVYGPGDPSQLGVITDLIRRGLVPFKAFPRGGFNFLHVDDAANGILLIHDKGRVGETYILGGEIARVGRFIDLVATISGRRAPRFTIPTPLVKLVTPLGPLVGPILKLPPNLAEAFASTDMTYWGSHDKVMRELGYSPRDLETGLRQTLARA